MLEHLLNQEVIISVAFATYSHAGGSVPEIYKGTLIAFDDKFIKLSDGTVFGIKYIQYIKQKSENEKKKGFFG